MTVEKNNKVTVEYEGRFDSKDGEIFDSSEGKAPLSFITGVGMVVPGFDNAIIGMDKGEEKEITLTQDEAYGPYRDELKQKVPRNVIPQDQKPEVGMMMVMATPQGQQMPAKITEVTDDEITLDINHPLAGKTLYFKLKLVDYSEVDADELAKMISPSGHSCSCSEDDACKTGEEDCKCSEGGECVDDSKVEGARSDDGESKKDEVSIEDLAEGK
jgi:FKBP-type peptidyl-prolyl cis-trans isomerase 2